MSEMATMEMDRGSLSEARLDEAEVLSTGIL